MVYQLPSKAQLKKFVTTLKTTTHSERKQTIERIQSYLSIDDPRLLWANIVKESEEIAQSYESSILPSAIYSPTRSDLYNELQSPQCLNNTATNPLDPQTKLLALWQVYKDKKSKLSESKEIKGSTSLEEEFQPLVDYVLKQIPNLKMALSERPTLDNILGKLKPISKEYETYYFETRNGLFGKITNGAPNLDHIKLSKLLEFVASSHMDDLINNFKRFNTKEEKAMFKYLVCYGLMLYIMKQIEIEYSGTSSLLGKPENSYIYRRLQEILRISHTDDIDARNKLIFFVDLRDFIQSLRADSAAKDYLHHLKISYPYYMTSYTTNFSDIDDFLKSILTKLENISQQESSIWSGVKWVTNYAVQTILVTACIELAAGIYTAGFGVGVVPFIFGRLGNRFMGGAIGERVGAIFGSQIEPALLTDLYANSIWFFGKKAVNSLVPTEDPLLSVCETSKKFRAELQEEISETTRKPNLLLTAILELPSKKISDQMKQHIKNMMMLAAPTPTSLEEQKPVKSLKMGAP